MKKYLAWLLVLAFPLLVTGCKLKKAKEEPVPESVLELPAEAQDPKFESQEYGFRVKGPEGWAKAPEALGMLVTYIKPGDPEAFQENISLAREDKGDLDLKTYADTTVSQIKEFFPDHEILGETSTKVQGVDAIQIRYKITVGELTIMAEQFIVDRPQQFLLITYMAAPKVFASSYPGVQSVLDSIVFVGGE